MIYYSLPSSPEALGVVCGAIFLCVMFLFMPIPFYKQLADKTPGKFPHHEVSKVELWLLARISILITKQKVLFLNSC